ncbi:S41 family peptidase, partial [Bacteroides cellulosilyticus]
QNTLRKEMPADTLQAIHALPSFSGTFATILKEIKKNRSEYLIIDLRGNSGGWTPIVLATLYQLYGYKYLQEDMDTEYYRIVSPLYMNKLEVTLEEFNNRYGTDYNFGDYTFSMEEQEDVPLDTLRRQ